MAPPPAGALDRRLCLVGGLNVNYKSRAGTPYHIQVEDLGPMTDRVSEEDVRRVNLIVYANYGDLNARIVHSHDHDFEDLRTAEHNRFIEQQVKRLADDARRVIEDREDKQVVQIKDAVRRYYQTKSEAAKSEFEAANATYPFLFSRAWRELREDRSRQAAAEAAAPTAGGGPPPLGPYPLDREQREQVLELERLIAELANDLATLKERGTVDDILLQTCRKLMERAAAMLRTDTPTEFDARRLEMTHSSLLTTWRQVKSRLKAAK